MNYYIDFDNTLYETAKLTQKMLTAIAESISGLSDKNFDEIFEYAKSNFDSTHDNIFSFSEKASQNYGVDSKAVLESVYYVIDNGSDLVFEDAVRFLERLKERGDKIILLTFLPKTNQEYQIRKVSGSKLGKYFDTMIMTTDLKFNLDLDYKNGVFIDDDPRDLDGLFEKNPIKVIRIRKENNKRSKIDIDNDEIEEYSSFDDINL